MDQATGQASAQEAGGGSTLLTEGVGTPQTDQQANGHDTTTQSQPQGRPEWFPEKFWRDGRPDNEGLAKSYTSLEKLLGSEKVPVPRSDDDQEGWDRWYAASGRPKEATEYAFEKPSELPEGFYDETAEQSFRDWAYQNGLNKRQAANLHKAYVKTQLERHQAWNDQQRQIKARLQTDLMREHGAAYEGFLSGAKAAVSKYSDPDFQKYLDETGLGNDPRMVRAFGRIGRDMMGETALRGKPKVEVNTGDLDMAISDYRKQHHAILMDKGHPDHDRILSKLNELYRKRFPE